MLWPPEQTNTVVVPNGTSLREGVCQLLKMLNVLLRYDLAMALLGSRHSYDKTNFHVQTSVCMLLEVLFIIAKNRGWGEGEEGKSCQLVEG